MIAFLLLAAVMVVGAVGVVSLREPVHAALSLVGTLLALAVVYITLHAQFLAAIQVIVYAGAIMVLFLFVIMLLNVQSDVDRESDRLPWIRPLAYGAGALVALAVGITAFSSSRPLPSPELIEARLLGGNAGPIGELLFTDFTLPFQLVGVLLLISILGAVGLVQRQAEAEARQNAAKPEEKELSNV
jgi:NADH-quinone oxidoreductase subunit J